MNISGPAARFAIGSILVGILVLILKYVAWLWTGSVALYSDALESIVNVAAAIAALAAISMAAKPPDRNHPFGHQKAEYFSAVLEGVLIVVAALSIMYEAWQALTGETRFAPTTAGLLVNAAASSLNGFWGLLLLRKGKQYTSPALSADGHHLLSDVVTSAGVLVGVIVAKLTGLYWLDPLIAIAVAIHIVWVGWKLIRNSLSGLMDEAAEPVVVDLIEELIHKNSGDAMEAHDIRTRKAGPMLFIDFHLVVPGEMSVSDAHKICDEIEKAIKERLGEASITIHVEPEHEITNGGVSLS